MGMVQPYHLNKQLQTSGTYVAKYTLKDVDMDNQGHFVKLIAENAFTSTPTLQKVIIPEGIEFIYEMFSGCTNLKEVIMPSTLKAIYYIEGEFIGCDSLEKIIFLGNPTTLSGGRETITLGQLLIALFTLNFDYETSTVTFIENAYGYCPSEYVNACNTAINEFIAQAQQAGTVQFVNLKENFFKPLNEA